MDEDKWMINDTFELSEEPLSIEEMREIRERHKQYGIDVEVTDEEFERIIERMKKEGRK